MIAEAFGFTNFLALSVADAAGQVVQVLQGGRGEEGGEAGRVALAVGEGLAHAVEIAARALDEVGEHEARQHVELVGQIGRAGEGLHGLIDSRGIGIGGQRLAPRDRILEGAEHGGQGLRGGAVEGLGQRQGGCREAQRREETDHEAPAHGESHAFSLAAARAYSERAGGQGRGPASVRRRASRAASATWVSCSPLPPLTPMPPTTSPSTSTGNPPTKIANLPGCIAWMPKASFPGSAGPPGGSLKRWVGRRCPAAVKALAMAISTPVSRAPVIRCSAMGWPPSSQTQIVSVTPISRARRSAASSMTLASSRVRRFTVIMGAPQRRRRRLCERGTPGLARREWERGTGRCGRRRSSRGADRPGAGPRACPR